jgi:Cft2 family RNA processing exonuclease
VIRFPPWRTVVDQLLDLVRRAMRAGRQPIVMGYTLGKAQEITRILTDAGVPVTVHGAVFHINRIYEEHGVRLGPYRRYNACDFHGPRAVPLEERGVLVAPPNVARGGFVTRFEDPLRVVLTGWGMLKNAPYRYGVDHVLPLSDHADFDELLELVERVRPKKIYSHHGYKEFADILRSRGYDAELARPDEQLRLFE